MKPLAFFPFGLCLSLVTTGGLLVGALPADDPITFPTGRNRGNNGGGGGDDFITFGSPRKETQPKSKSLPEPSPCPNHQTFCGGDSDLYPVEHVDAILRKTLSLENSAATRDQFFKKSGEEEDQGLGTRGEFAEQNSLSHPPTACMSDTETIPLLARAMNREGKWKYLAQMTGNRVQHHQIVKCRDPGIKCINDKDSPEPQSTVCRQIFKTARMLAFDEKGEIEVDSFRLPSACVCHYINEIFRVRVSSQLAEEREVCEVPVEKLDKPELDFLKRRSQLRRRRPLIERRRGGRRRGGRQQHQDSTRFLTVPEGSFVEACPDGESLCQTGDEFYPEEQIKPAIKKDTVLDSTGFFSNVFGSACVPANDTQLRNAFDRAESALCRSIESYIFPRRAQNINGVWRYIVNSDEYKQGVTISKCAPATKGRACKYGGSKGQFPDATECSQLYTRHNMLAVSEEGEVFVDSFKVPSSCICRIVDPEQFSEDDGF